MLNLNYIPILNPDIVTGISLMVLFIFMKMNLGFVTMLLAHITFNIPYVILSILPKLKQMNKHLYEAALDLGATPAEAFWKVILPEIMPGVITGFLLAFTLSLDDFVISFFTTGSGVSNLSIVIFGMARRGISPKINALSTLMFVSVLTLLIIVNIRMSKDNPERRVKVKEARKMAAIFLILVMIFSLAACGGGGGGQKVSTTINVFNWGDYIDESVLTDFEKEYGIKVNYDYFATNEEMYVKLKSGGTDYDVLFPSDYMIARLIKEDMLHKLDFNNIPNIEHIDDRFKNLDYDPNNEYSVPYMWGTVGIAYNTTMVDEPVDSWNILWDPKYEGNILMMDSQRDSIAVALKKLGYSLNSRNEAELEQAKEELIKQKPLVLSYVGDEVKDKMIGGEAALAVVYSGEVIAIRWENPDIAYSIPKKEAICGLMPWLFPNQPKQGSRREVYRFYDQA